MSPARARKQRVLLATPPYHCGMVESAGVWMPLGLAYLASSLERAGHESEIYDAMSLFHDEEQVRARLERSMPDVVAVTAYTATIGAASAVLRIAKESVPGVVTVVGGVHPTHMAEDVLRDTAVDFVVRGEGERTLPELLACLEEGGTPWRVPGVSCREGAGVLHAPDRPLARSLDEVEPAWHLLDWPLYHYRTKPGSRLAIASWSRGCTHACTFCSQHKMWRGTWRGRSVDAIVAEARMLASKWGVDTLEIADEYPTCGRERWERILDRLLAEDLGIELLVETRAADIVRDADILGKYREAGVLHMYVGVETPRQDRLDGMRKDLAAEHSRRSIELLNEAGIITETSFLLGFPDETPETVRQTLDAALDYDPDLAFFIAVTPWPYSDMYADVADRVEERDYARYNLTNPIMRPEAMTREEVSAAMAASFMAFYRNKMSRLGSLPVHKRKYLGSVTKLLIEDSYLSAEVTASLGVTSMSVQGEREDTTAPAEGRHGLAARVREDPCVSPY